MEKSWISHLTRIQLEELDTSLTLILMDGRLTENQLIV